MELSYPLLTTIIFLPIAAALVLFFVDSKKENFIKSAAFAASLITFALSLPLYSSFDRTKASMQFVERHSWIRDWNISYYLGVDGISVFMVLLSTLVSILCILISWNAIKEKVKEFYLSLLLLEGFMIGVFCSLDLFLFYIFWEAMLIPMFLIIGIWGGPKRVYAAVKFFLYTLVGSLLMLLGIIIIYLYGHTFDVVKLMEIGLPYRLQVLLFWAFFAAFAVKVPMFPVHTWLPDAHTEAPAAGSVILAAVLIKMGAYGFLRFSLPLFPLASIAMGPAMIVLSLIAIVYGGLICLVQTDLKRLIAYSSVSHMGFVTLGIFSLNVYGIEGGIMQMINHGIVTGALFLSVGIIYERTHTRQISDYGGLAKIMPYYAAFFFVFTLAAIGLPGTNGFVGEFLAILGGFKARMWAGVVAATGIIIGAVYMLWLYQRIFFTGVNEKIQGLKDISLRELMCLLPMFLLVLWIGFYPDAILNVMDVSVAELVKRVKSAADTANLDSGFLLGLSR